MKTKLFFILSLLLLFVGCGVDKDPKIIYFGIAQKAQNLDPRFSADASSERINQLIYSYLFEFDEHQKVNSNLVKYKQIDNVSYEFTLYKNLPSFSDGARMTLDDILASIGHLKNLSSSPFYSELQNIRNVKKLDSNSFSIELNHADQNFLTRLHLPIMRATHLDQGHNFSQKPIGSGTFFIPKFTQPEVLQRKSDGQLVRFEEIKDPTVRALKLMRGEIDLLQNDIPTETVGFLKKQAGLTVKENVGSNVTYLGFNFSDDVLSNPDVRKAIMMGINREEIIAFFFSNQTKLANQFFSEDHWASQPIGSLPYNPIKAKKIINAFNGNQPLKINFKTSTDPFRLKLATIIQRQLNEINIDLKISSLDWGTYFKDIQSGNFQMYSLTWVGIKNPDIHYKIFHSTMVPPLGLNRGFYHNDKLDKQLNLALNSNDWREVIETIYSDVAFLPLWYEGNVVVYSDKITDYRVSNDGNWQGLKYIKKDDS